MRPPALRRELIDHLDRTASLASDKLLRIAQDHDFRGSTMSDLDDYLIWLQTRLEDLRRQIL